MVHKPYFCFKARIKKRKQKKSYETGILHFSQSKLIHHGRKYVSSVEH